MLARDNPFSTTKVEKVLAFDPSLNGTTWEEIETRWLKLGMRASLVGPHGAGKTTFIDTFAQRLTNKGESVYRVFLNTEMTRMSAQQWEKLSNCEGEIVILDGEEQLGFLQRRRFYKLTKNAAGVLISRHNEGKLPSLHDFQPSLKTLEVCVQRLAPEHYAQLEPHFEKWWNEHNGNIREILLECYDFIAAKH